MGVSLFNLIKIQLLLDAWWFMVNSVTPMNVSCFIWPRIHVQSSNNCSKDYLTKDSLRDMQKDSDLLCSHSLVQSWSSTSSRSKTALLEDESPGILNFYSLELSTYRRKTVCCICYITFYRKVSNSTTLCFGQLNLNCTFLEYTWFFSQCHYYLEVLLVLCFWRMIFNT